MLLVEVRRPQARSRRMVRRAQRARHRPTQSPRLLRPPLPAAPARLPSLLRARLLLRSPRPQKFQLLLPQNQRPRLPSRGRQLLLPLRRPQRPRPPRRQRSRCHLRPLRRQRSRCHLRRPRARLQSRHQASLLQLQSPRASRRHRSPRPSQPRQLPRSRQPWRATRSSYLRANSGSPNFDSCRLTHGR